MIMILIICHPEQGKVRMGKRKVGEEKSKAKREAPGENASPE